MSKFTNEKTPDVSETSGASSRVSTDGGVNHQPHLSTNGGGKQAGTLAAGSVEELGGTNLLDSALRYGQQGWKIFPVDGKKEPLTPHSFKDATIDPAQIEA
jgi:hypothetical protein